MKFGKAAMSLAFLLSGCVCGLAVEAAAGTDTAERSEVWDGKMYSSTFRAAMCVAPDGKARGVLLLRQRSGKVDTYHFYGEERNGVIAVSHSSGKSAASSRRMATRGTAPAHAPRAKCFSMNAYAARFFCMRSI